MADPIVSFQEQAKWKAEAFHEFQQMNSKFEDKVIKAVEQTKVYHFNRFSKGTYNTDKALTAEFSYGAKLATDVPCTPQDIYSAYLIDDMEEWQSNIDFRKAFMTKVAAEVKRGIDDKIIAALNTTANVVTMPTANTLLKTGTDKLAEQFVLADAFEMAQLYLAVSPGGLTDITGDANVFNAFHNKNEIVANYTVGKVSGFQVFPTTRLPNGAGGSAFRRNFTWRKDAVGSFYRKTYSFRMDYIPDKGSWQVLGRVVMGAVIIEPNGVYAADIAN